MRWGGVGPSLSAWLLPLYIKPAVGLSYHVLLITRSTRKHFLSCFLSRTGLLPNTRPPNSSSIFFHFTPFIYELSNSLMRNVLERKQKMTMLLTHRLPWVSDWTRWNWTQDWCVKRVCLREQDESRKASNPIIPPSCFPPGPAFTYSTNRPQRGASVWEKEQLEHSCPETSIPDIYTNTAWTLHNSPLEAGLIRNNWNELYIAKNETFALRCKNVQNHHCALLMYLKREC